VKNHFDRNPHSEKGQLNTPPYFISAFCPSFSGQKPPIRAIFSQTDEMIRKNPLVILQSTGTG